VWSSADRREGEVKLKEMLKMSVVRRFPRRVFAHWRGLDRGVGLSLSLSLGRGVAGGVGLALQEAIAVRISCSSWRMVWAWKAWT
jgi:hypothetical protein